MKKIVIFVVAIFIIAGVVYVYQNKDNGKESANNEVNATNEVTDNSEKVENLASESTNVEKIAPTTELSDSNVKKALMDALQSKNKFINENNEQVLFKDFKITDEEKAVPEEYTFVDLDNDGKDELVVYTTSDYGAYVILKVIDNDVYGYMIGIRSFENLKKDGCFIQSSGASDNNYCRMTFSKTKYTVKNNVVKTEEEWDAKENAEWIIYDN